MNKTNKINKQIKIYFIKTTLKNALNIDIKNLNKKSVEEIDKIIFDFKIPLSHLILINDMITKIN